MRYAISFFQGIDSQASIGFGGIAGNITRVLLTTALPCLEEQLPHIGWFMLIGAVTGFSLNCSTNNLKQGNDFSTYHMKPE